jgi:hypothetical protein
MSPRIVITLVIIVALGVGAGAVVFGVLEAVGIGNDKTSTIIAVGAMLIAAGGTALVAHIGGAFRDLDEDQ